MRVGSVSREEVWASAGVQGAWVGACGTTQKGGFAVYKYAVENAPRAAPLKARTRVAEDAPLGGGTY